MKTTLILQANGNKLKATLKSISRPTQLRIATAYVSGTTASILKTFAATPKVLLVDYDARCLTEQVLNKLLALSQCSVFLADIAETFHPKVYILDTPTHMHLFIGSNNATLRGLETNVEVATYSVLDRRSDSALIMKADALWTALARIASTRLDSKLIASRRHELARRLPGSKANPHAKRLRALSLAVPLGLPRVLYKIINRETGAGGTQIQFPIEVVRDYFGSDGRANVRLLVSFGGNVYPVQLTHHPNNTHRIALPFLAGTPRPAVLRFKRTSGVAYSLDVFGQHDPKYTRTIRLGMSARRGANRYRILP